METSNELVDSVVAWEDSARRLFDIAASVAPVDELTWRGVFADSGGSVGAPLGDEREVEVAGDDFIAASERVFQLFQRELDEPTGSITDARGRASALIGGGFSVVEAIMSATEDRGDLRGVVALDRDAIEGDWTYGADLARYSSAMLGYRSIGGGAMEPMTTLDGELVELADAGAAEIVGLAKNTVVTFSASTFLEGAGALLGSGAATLIEHLRGLVQGAWQFMKRVATKVIGWIVEKIDALVPELFKPYVDQLLGALADRIQAGIDPERLTSLALMQILGAQEARRAWANASDDARGDAAERLPTVTDPHLRRIGWVTTGRTAIDKWGGAVIRPLLSGANPAVQVTFFAVVASVFIFVGVQVWDGFDDLEDLV